MNYLHYDLDLATDEIIEIKLSGRANVMLLNDTNFSNYRKRRPVKYHAGGYATKSPVRLASPRPGKWHLVIDLGGYAGSVSASVRTLKAAA